MSQDTGASNRPLTLDEWLASLAPEDKRQIGAIILFTPFAKDYLHMAFAAGVAAGINAGETRRK